jgi:hypothetical protein
MAIGLLFFVLSDYRNIKYRIGELKKLSDIGSIPHSIVYRTQKKPSVVHLLFEHFVFVFGSKRFTKYSDYRKHFWAF